MVILRMKTTYFYSVLILVTGWMLGIGGCSSAQVVKSPDALPEEPPPLVQVPHPQGFDLGDVRAIFNEKGAPELETNKNCDTEYRKLLTLTQSREELKQGAREFVRNDPVKYHWCFYTKIIEMEAGLQKDTYIEERQKRVLDTYDFLTPVAQAFQSDFHDSRYLRWAIQRYRRLSEWVFFRKVEISPQTTLEMSVIENPFALWRQPTDDHKPILEKYGFVAPPGTPDPLKSAREPAQSPAQPGNSAGVPGEAALEAPQETPPDGKDSFNATEPASKDGK